MKKKKLVAIIIAVVLLCTTAVAYAAQTKNNFDGIIICNGENFPDALCASSLEDVTDYPIYMVGKAETDISGIQKQLKDGAAVYIIGSDVVVSSSLENNLKNAGYSVKRLAGDNRYTTNQAVLDEVSLIEGTAKG